MLILQRKAGESLVIGEDIKISILSIDEHSVKLAIDAPKEVPILRTELLSAMKANRDAAEEQNAPEALLNFITGKK